MEFIYFDAADYRAKIACKHNNDLAEKIYAKRRQLAASQMSITASLAAVPVTHGTSLLGAVVSARSSDVDQQKVDLLEEEWSRRGLLKLPERIIKDTVIPTAISSAVGAVTLGVDCGMAAGVVGTSLADHVLAQGVEVGLKQIGKMAGNAAAKSNTPGYYAPYNPLPQTYPYPPFHPPLPPTYPPFYPLPPPPLPSSPPPPPYFQSCPPPHPYPVSHIPPHTSPHFVPHHNTYAGRIR